MPGEGAGASQWKPDESVQRLRFYGILSFVWGVPDYGIGHSILETSCKQCKRFSKFVIA